MLSISWISKADLDEYSFVSKLYSFLWSIQVVSISARFIAYFQTSSYFGVMIRMLARLTEEMLSFCLCARIMIY